MKLVHRRNYHKGRAAIRHYANLREPSDSLRFKLYNPPQVLAFFLLSTLVLLGYWGWWAVLYCSRTETEASQEVTTDHHQLLQRGMYQDTMLNTKWAFKQNCSS